MRLALILFANQAKLNLPAPPVQCIFERVSRRSWVSFDRKILTKSFPQSNFDQKSARKLVD
jgi:hypothetical protein